MKSIFLAILSVALTACTIAPAPVHPKVASSWIVSHRVGYDSSGYIVDLEWVRSYKAYYTNYGTKLPIREQVTDLSEGITITDHGNYHVTFETNRRMDHLIEIERNSGP